MPLGKVSLDGRLTVIAGPNPPTDDGFCSNRVQVLHWRVDEPYRDKGSHLHQRSDEVYVVLEGAIELDVEGEVTTVTAGEAATVGAGISHAVAGVHFPARGLTIRGPAVDDKVVPVRGPLATTIDQVVREPGPRSDGWFEDRRPPRHTGVEMSQR